MTATEMVLEYWGFDKQTDLYNLSETQRADLKGTIDLMARWQEHNQLDVKKAISLIQSARSGNINSDALLQEVIIMLLDCVPQ